MIVAVTLIVAAIVPSASDDAAFVAWARRSMVALPSAPQDDELAAFGKLIGDAKVVALGEGDHFAAEPLVFRNRVLEYLVRHKGFTAIAIESGAVEGRVVDNYVQGGAGTLAETISQGIGWTFDRLPQNAELIRWLRTYNASGRGRKIHFYGFDVPGSPGNPRASRGMETALTESLAYLDRVDRDAGAHFHGRLDSFLPHLRFDRYQSRAAGYPQLTRGERDGLTASIEALRALLAMREHQYTRVSSVEDYQSALHAVAGALQVDSWLRQIPLDWRASDEQQRFLDVASDYRDRAQADNIAWIVQREGPDGKVLVYAHNGHLSTAPVIWRWWPLDADRKRASQPSGANPHEVAGTYLRQQFGSRLVTVGNLIGGGAIGCGKGDHALGAAVSGSVDAAASEIGAARFLLDLRAAPAAVGEWLERERQLGFGFEISGRYHITLHVPMRRAFDAVVYSNQVTPACP